MSGRSRELPDDQLDLGLTHAAIYVRAIEASVRFYERYAGLRAIHRRGSGAARVAWVSDLKRPFGLVLIQRRGGPLRRLLSRTLSPLRLLPIWSSASFQSALRISGNPRFEKLRQKNSMPSIA